MKIIVMIKRKTSLIMKVIVLIKRKKLVEINTIVMSQWKTRSYVDNNDDMEAHCDDSKEEVKDREDKGGDYK